ncbi:MAG: SusC/RagA family TonB-linked outer membrane protein [Muribaculaceae bacterium]|nr:SusC/RagA family TonB-linked outer membrane protein [Muribaculaceae bacterium]
MTLVACSWAAMAQTTYRGTVVDAESNEPLIGATIMPIGGGQGGATDIDGKYSITVPSNVHQAKVTYVGYKEQVVKLTNNMTIKLVSTEQNLDDLVVVAYGTATKESLTGSVAVVGAKEIEERPVTSVTAALEGNAPGVMVNNSQTAPGQSPSIRIRGFNSFSANTPLYVVDGVVYQGDIAEINPNDIESMSVLKDAASCALYGNRGANGVILITTKRAKNKEKVDVSLNVRLGMYNRGLPFYDTLGTNDWMETAYNGYAHGQYTSKGFKTFEAALAGAGAGFINGYLKGSNLYGVPGGELFTPDGRLGAYDEEGNFTPYSYLPGYTDLDWWKAVSRTGNRQEYSLSAAGATEKFNVFASAAYLKEQGYMLQTDFERFTGRIVANFQPTSYFKMGINLSGVYSESSEGGADPDALTLVTNPFLVEFNPPVQPYYAHNEDGSIQYDEDGKPIWNTTGLNVGDNVAWTMRLNESKYNTATVNGLLYGTAILPYGFEFTVKGQMWRSKLTGYDYSNNVIGSQKGVGGLDTSVQTVKSHTFMQTLDWSHDYGLNHVDVLLNHENYQYGYDVEFNRYSGQLYPDNITLISFENNDIFNQSNALIRTESYLGRVRYNYDQKYFGEASIRRDGTSRFAKNNRWGTFWSVGGSWIISREKFMEPTQGWLNYLKLRLAYGAVGNDAAASAYSYQNLYGSTQYDGVGVLVPVQIGSENLKWESTNTLDVALEGSLFNDRFNFSIGYFDKRNADLIYNIVQPASGGMLGNNGSNISILGNVGTMSNRGWELQFGVDIIRNADFHWNFSLDASFIKNKIVKLPNNRDLPGQGWFIGKSFMEQFEYTWAGVDKVTGNSLYEMAPDSPDWWVYDDNNRIDRAATAENYASNVLDAKKSGHYYVLNGKEYTDQTAYAGKQLQGSVLPVVQGSFGTNLSWKGINVGMLFTYSLGGKTYNGNYERMMNLGVSPDALHKDILNSWTEADAMPGYMNIDGEAVSLNGHPYYKNGFETIYFLGEGDIDPNGTPVLDTNLSQYNNAGSSRWIMSNNFLCFKNLSVSYDLPQKWMQAIKLQNINVGVSIDNVSLVTRKKGLNPQASFGSAQSAYYVPARVFAFQLGVKF